jgi:hypothetical protein
MSKVETFKEKDKVRVLKLCIEQRLFNKILVVVNRNLVLVSLQSIFITQETHVGYSTLARRKPILQQKNEAENILTVSEFKHLQVE